MNYMSVIRRALREDASIRDYLGPDQNGEIKVYNSLAVKNVQAPYIVVHTTPISDVQSAYGDAEIIEVFNLQFSCWGRQSNEAWQVWGMLHDAWRYADLAFDPYEVLHVRRVSSPQELPDSNTQWRQVVVLYEIALAR